MMFPHKDFVLNGADEQEPIYFGVPKVAITEVNLGTSTNSQEVWVSNSLSFTQKKPRKTPVIYASKVASKAMACILTQG